MKKGGGLKSCCLYPLISHVARRVHLPVAISTTATHRPPPPALMGWSGAPPHLGLPGGSFLKSIYLLGHALYQAGSFVSVHGLSSCGVQAQLLQRSGLRYPTACGILVPGPGIEPTSPTMEGRFLTIGHQGSPYQEVLYGWPRQPAPSPSEAQSLKRVEMDSRD